MQTAENSARAGKKPRRRTSYSDDLDEAPSTVRDQPVEIQEEIPIEDNPSIEAGDDEQEPSPPVFEE